MATKLRLKKSSVANKKPDASDLDYGELAINYQDGNLYYKNADNDVKSFQETAVEFTARNESGFAVTKGQAVYINGVSGSTPTIALADADNASAMPAFGLLKANANNNAEVVIIVSGNDVGVDTSSFAVGDTLYVSTTPGVVTNVKPAGEASLIQNIGKVVRSHATEGIIKVLSAGRTAATPNLNAGNIFIGNDSNYASTTSIQTETRKHIVSGTGVGYDSASGVISIGQDVGTTSDVTFGKVTGDSGDFDIIKLNTTQWTDINVPDNLPTFQEGNLFYFQGPDALTYSNHKINVKIGQDEITRVYNNTGSTIAKGQAVYVTGATNDFPTIALARANSFNTVYETMGLTSNEILNGEFGYVTVRGLFGGLDTTSYSVGDIVHVSPDDPGTLVNFSPTYPNFAFEMGVVLVSDSATGGNVGGCIQVNPHSEIVETFRGTGEGRFDGDLTVAGSLTVLGSQTTVGQSNVTQGAPFYRLNEGDAIGEAGTTFTGSGLNDAFFAGHFTGPSEQSYYVRIDGVGTGTGGVDTFKVALGQDSAFASPILTTVDITGSPQLIHSTDNISVDFTATTGHTLNDTWKGTAAPINVDTGFFTNRNTGTSGVGYTHMGFFFDASDEKWKVIDEYDSVPTGIIEVTDSSLGILVADTFEGSFTGNLTGSASQFGGLNTTQFLRSDTADTKTSGDLSFSDNVKAVFGAGSDLQIYSDGANSIIHETDGTGNLIVKASNINLQNSGGTATLAQFIDGGKSSLRYNAVEKLATTSTGIDVTGQLDVNSAARIDSSGIVKSANGTEAAPTHAFLNDPDNGMFRPTTNTVGFSTAGTERMRIDNSGNVGIGVTPSAWDVLPAIQVSTYGGLSAGGGYTRLSSNAYLSTYPNTWSYIATNTASLYEQVGGQHIWSNAASGTAGNAISFSEAMRIDSSGNVGIGTSSPSRQLHLASSVPSIRLEDTDVSGLYAEVVQLVTGDLSFRADHGNVQASSSISFSVDTTEAMRISSGGDVGIGTTSPTFNTGSGIEIERAGEATLRLQDTTNTANGEVRSGNAGLTFYAGAYGTSGAPFIWNAGGTERLRIDSSGNVLIKTASHTPTDTELVVSSEYSASGTTDAGITLSSRQGGNWRNSGIFANGDALTFTTGDTGVNGAISTSEKMRIDSSGNVGIGTTTPTAILDAQGSQSFLGNFQRTNAGLAAIRVSGQTGEQSIIQMGDADDGDIQRIQSNNSDNSFAFFTNNGERLRIDSSGNVGIGTSSPTTILEVKDTSSSPSISITGPNTGSSTLNLGDSDDINIQRIISDHTNDSLQIHTNNAERMRIDSSGNVGIGTSSPSHPLTIQADGTSGNSIKIIGDSTNSSGRIMWRNSADTAEKGRIAVDTSSNMTFHAGGGTERMRIDSSGNVGIGTNSPASLLHLSSASDTYFTIGTTNATADARIQFRNSGGTDAGGLWYATNGNNMLFRTNSAERMRIDSSGNVGIGTNSPAWQLHVKGTSNAVIQIEGASNAGSFVNFGDPSDTDVGQIGYDHTSNYMRFKTNDTEHMRIDSSGNVGIGNTSSGYLFTSGETRLAVGDGSEHAAIQIYSGTAKWGGLEFADDATNGTGQGFIGYYHPSDYMQFNTSGTEHMRIDSSGRVGIGTSSPTGSLHTTVKDSNGSDVFVVAQNTTSNRVAGFRVLDESGTTSLQMQYDNGGNNASIINPNNGSLAIYLGGTGAANQLDDYEEGTWTPAVANMTVTGTLTSAGRYTKVGRMVSVMGWISATTSIAHGVSALISGFPFPGAVVTGESQSRSAGVIVAGGNADLPSSNHSAACFVDSPNSRAFLGNFTTTAAGEYIYINAVYYTA